MDSRQFLEVLAEYEAAAWGQKGAVLKARLPLLGVSAPAFHAWRRLMGRGHGRKPRRDRGKTKYAPDVREWVKKIMAVKHSGVKGVDKLATWNAIETAVALGEVPPEAAALSPDTVNWLARRMKLTEAPRRGARFQAGCPNDLHQVDASGSRHFFPYKTVGGEWILKLRPRQLPNKEKVEGLRVWCWGLADDHSGFRVQRYCVAPGEAALDGVDFLRWAWSPAPEHAPFEGLPGILYLDNGALAKYVPFRAFCEECGIELRTHEPYRPQATGKTESGWRDLKKEFEGRFMRDRGWAKREISLTELNQELAAFRRQTNQTKHRSLPLTKEEAWLTLMHRGGPVRLTPESWERIFTQNVMRTLDDAGCFSLGGIAYQVKELWACRVRVYQSLTADALVVEDPQDGRRYHAAPFVPQSVGEWRAAPKTELERALEEREQEAGNRPTWQPGAAGNLVHLVKAGEVRESSFQMPEKQGSGVRAQGPERPSLDDLAGGVEVIERPDEVPGLFATPLERYEHLLAREIRGQHLSPEETEFLAWFRGEYREMLELVGRDLERKVLAVAE